MASTSTKKSQVKSEDAEIIDINDSEEEPDLKRFKGKSESVII